ncbi:hypothetical protein ACWIWA_11090, partial [Ursidibacter arcticus]
KGQVFYSFSKKCIKALYYKLLTHFLATILSITPINGRQSGVPIQQYVPYANKPTVLNMWVY